VRPTGVQDYIELCSPSYIYIYPTLFDRESRVNKAEPVFNSGRHVSETERTIFRSDHLAPGPRRRLQNNSDSRYDSS